MNKTHLLLILFSALSIPFCTFSAENRYRVTGEVKYNFYTKKGYSVTGNVEYFMGDVVLRTNELRAFNTPTGSSITSMEKLETELKLDKIGTRKVYIDVFVLITENDQEDDGTAYGVVVQDIDSIGDTQTKVYNSISLDELKRITEGQAVPVLLGAEKIFDVIEETQKTIISKYPDETSIARKLATEELEKIARSNKTEEDRIAAIRAKFPSTPTSPDKTEQGTKEKTGN